MSHRYTYGFCFFFFLDAFGLLLLLVFCLFLNFERRQKLQIVNVRNSLEKLRLDISHIEERWSGKRLFFFSSFRFSKSIDVCLWFTHA
jgi:hypothetical protein